MPSRHSTSFMQRLLVLVSSLTLSSSSQTYYDCEKEGCPWSGPPVCGMNGVTYTSECLAYCQDMAVASIGSCSDSSGIASVPYDDGTNVTLDVMQRFQKENFILIGRRNIHELVLPEDNPTYSADSEAKTLEQPLFWSRFTYDGYEYTAPATDDDQRRLFSIQEEVEFLPSVRSLAIVGADTRQVVANNHNRLPYSPICELDYGFGLSEGGCTGTLIGKSSVLTAGHCLFNYAKNEFTYPLRMAPGRYRQGSTTVEPYGLFGFKYLSVLSPYQTTENQRYDIGIVTYGANSQGQFPGDLAGTLCLAEATTKKLNSRTVVAGYAADVADGNLMEAKGCSMRLSSGMIEHNCDTASGQSGGPVLSGSQIVGMHLGFDPDTPTNVAIAWNNASYNAVYTWAPDAKYCVESNVRSCNCSSVQRPLIRLLCGLTCRLAGGAA